MAQFHSTFRALHREIWDSGPMDSRELACLLEKLEHSDLPEGVLRLPTARMRAGPHLAAQSEADTRSCNVMWLDAYRVAREWRRARV